MRFVKLLLYVFKTTINEFLSLLRKRLAAVYLKCLQNQRRRRQVFNFPYFALILKISAYWLFHFQPMELMVKFELHLCLQRHLNWFAPCIFSTPKNHKSFKVHSKVDLCKDAIKRLEVWWFAKLIEHFVLFPFLLAPLLLHFIIWISVNIFNAANWMKVFPNISLC